jgi:plasmid maintenance system antidote protein VapI
LIKGIVVIFIEDRYTHQPDCEHSTGSIPDTALRLDRYFGTGAEFWMNLQSLHDITTAKMELGKKIEIEVLPRSA